TASPKACLHGKPGGSHHQRLALSAFTGFARTYASWRLHMIPIDLDGKVALVTGVGDNQSFAWFIAKGLQAAGARLVFASHPRMVNIVGNLLESEKPDDAEA